MSSTKSDEGAADHAAPVVVVDGQAMADNDHLEEKPAAPLAAINILLVMPRDLSERMNRMEVSQREQSGRY